MENKIERLIIILVTCGSEIEANKIGELLVSLHLAACVNIADVKSIFEWKDKQEYKSEKLLVIKTLKSRFAKIEELVKATHSYDCPEIIASEISDASDDYAEWVRKMCEAE